jgi:putative ubiquitin-RnfH superfamily antitoxin RatB of RatAB toxin-antitoxin module
VRIQVVYALPERQSVELLELEEGATVADALAAVADKPPFNDLDLSVVPVGVYGDPVTRDTPLQAGDRVEIYRPLLADPKEARRRRAGRQ